MKAYSIEEFKTLSTSSKNAYFKELLVQFRAKMEEGQRLSSRRGSTQGSVFLWISVYGSDVISKAFITYLKNHGERMIQKYRGDKNAWYFGSQTDVGFYDGLVFANKWLKSYGIQSGVGDAWD